MSIMLTESGCGAQGFAVALKMGVSKKMMDTVVGVHPSSAGNVPAAPCPEHSMLIARLSCAMTMPGVLVPCLLSLSMEGSPACSLGLIGKTQAVFHDVGCEAYNEGAVMHVLPPWQMSLLPMIQCVEEQ